MTDLHALAQQMVTPYKGILAADESNSTAGKRLATINLESTPENRRRYRELFLGTPGIERYLSGVIFYDETFRQTMACHGSGGTNGTTFLDHLKKIGVIPGIKVDAGLQDLPNFPGEQYTQGLDNVRDRLVEYKTMGAMFTKWRSVIKISDPSNSDNGQAALPTEAAIHSNCHAMSLYAALVQEVGMVPMVEPEVLIDGPHTIEQSYEVTTKMLKTLFTLLKHFRVDIKGTILKTSMVISGKECPEQADAKTVGEMTWKCLKESVPAELGGVVFLSGGQSTGQATDNLNEIVKAAQAEGKLPSGTTPWQLTFSYARALQGDPLKLWAGDDKNLPAARARFLELLEANSAARMGQWEGKRSHNGLSKKTATAGVSQD